ncbi:MAG: hypothetical protein PGN33_01680 [Methylobacterium radiotolerans]
MANDVNRLMSWWLAAYPREPDALPVSKRIPEVGEATGNARIMVHVPPDVRDAVKHLAVDERRSTSSVYVEAARAFLETRGRQVVDDPAVTPPPRASEAMMLSAAIKRQERRIDELHAAIDDVRGGGPRRGQGPAGTKLAEAMKVVLEILKGAGATGMVGRDLDAAVLATGVRSGTVETAKAVLRGAGLVRCEGRRWYLGGV